MRNHSSMQGLHGSADFGNLQSIVSDVPFGGVDYTYDQAMDGADFGYEEMGQAPATQSPAMDFLMKNKVLVVAAIFVAAMMLLRKKRR